MYPAFSGTVIKTAALTTGLRPLVAGAAFASLGAVPFSVRNWWRRGPPYNDGDYRSIAASHPVPLSGLDAIAWRNQGGGFAAAAMMR
jgi:hypothetical protein